ncbi:MAG TPA: glycoside hydrolase family 18 protein [Terriglobia bacterium]|nr:glycoside hydrolase family 18 protein [Terriglobia bacterium]
MVFTSNAPAGRPSRIATRTLAALLICVFYVCPTPFAPAYRNGVAAAAPAPETETFWSVGYWTPWGAPPLPSSRITWKGLTHVVYAWALVRPDGSLDLETQRVSREAPALIAGARANNVKALLGVGQQYWAGQTTSLAEAAGSHRSILVNNIIDIVNRYGFDGVDLDWEPLDTARDGAILKKLASDLRSRLGGKTLSAAAIVTDYQFWGTAHAPFDRVSAMTYDLTGVWNPFSWHNAPLYSRSDSFPKSPPADATVWSVDLAVERFTRAGVPAARLNVGIPFFGYEWAGGGVTGPNQRWISEPRIRQLPYQSLTGLISPAIDRWDSSARVPYSVITSTRPSEVRFFTYDNEQSIAEKIRYAQSRRLGGWMIWELSGDYLPGQTPDQPLLNAIANERQTLNSSGAKAKP